MTNVESQVTPRHLTAVLHAAGVLLNGEVVEVVIEASKDTLVSRLARLRLTYDRAAAVGPLHLFLKTRRDGISQQWSDIGRKEARFYELVAPSTPAGLVPRCYDVVTEPSGYWHLLLEDLTASHEPVGPWPLPPPAERWHAVVEAHARFHATWWDDRRLGDSVGAFLDDSGELGRHVEALPQDLALFADRLGGHLSAQRRRLYERLITSAPRLLERYRSHHRLTLVHGDAHVWNAMVSRNSGAKDVRLIDWDGWRVDMATDDIAYMLALHWYPDWRSRYEEETLRRYHDMLAVHGVQDYRFEALWQDYRLSVLWQIITPMWQANHGLAPVIWWNNLERIMLAVHDLGCPELLV